MGSVNYSSPANGWDVTIRWDCSWNDSSAQLTIQINQNNYGRTFQVVQRYNTSARYNSGDYLSVGTEYLLYVYRNGAYSQQDGPFTVTAPAPPTYTVSYNANGGYGAPGSQTKYHDTPLTLSGDRPTRTGYNFLGWNTYSSATSASYSPGSTYNSNSSVTLYAVWQRITYTVSYNANGGSGAPGSQTKYHGENLALSSTKPYKTGHYFKEWNTSSAGNGTPYQPGATYSSNAALTLYAIWVAETYPVTFQANGGSSPPASQVKTYGQTLTLTTAKPVRTGYTFLRWDTSQTGNGTSYSPGAPYTGNTALKLYAIWSANSYSIKFNKNGGSGNMTDQSMVYDRSGNLKKNEFFWAGRTFLGWSKSPTGGVDFNDCASVSNLVTSAGGSITLYAVWSINSILIKFDAATNGGSSSETSRSINYSSALGNLPIAARPYYKFSGWFTAPTGGTKITPTTTFTSDATIYAQFVIDASVKVKVGGKWKPGIPYVKVNGAWKKGYAWAKTAAGWKQGHG